MLCDRMLRGFPKRLEESALQIGGRALFPLEAVAEAAGVTRQTLWRWRKDRKIPLGHKLRNRRIVFSETEAAQVLEYAHQLEPIAPEEDPNQLSLL
jgi:predicted DNA-binding transcriptional regulator AlpA